MLILHQKMGSLQVGLFRLLWPRRIKSLLMVSACRTCINSFGLLGFMAVVLPSFSLFALLPMSTHPPSSQPGNGNGSHSRLGFLSSPSLVLCTPPRDAQLEGGDVVSHNIHSYGQPESSPTATDLGTPTNLAGKLRPFLSPSYQWLGQEDLTVVGTCPIDAGSFADVWLGKMGDRKVAVKSYRCYASASCTSTYDVSHPLPPSVMCALTVN
jgi:hypothetical protein